MELSVLSKASTTGTTVKQEEYIRVEIYRQGCWQELPFRFLTKGDRFRPINGTAKGIVLKCAEDAVEHSQPDLWVVSAQPELS
jgi:hypothetical protein